jgi:purine nucleosidase/pyrimidine-specific ribonucleoside hydrolase
MIEKQKIIIDTDIGDDIDDAFAIAYAMASPELDILGVTTVYKNVKQRAYMAKALLCAGGFDSVPVYEGLNEPLVEPMSQFSCETKGKDGLVNLRHYRESMTKYEYQKGSGIDFILDTADKYPGEVTLVAIGPLTNVAVAKKTRPESYNKLKQIVLMNGFFNSVSPEWNVLCDPEATKEVYASEVPVTTVGANCTHQVVVLGEHLDKIRSLTGPVGDLLNEMLTIWFNDNNRPCIMHDSLALSVLLDDFLKFEKQNIVVPLEFALRGYTVKMEGYVGGREKCYSEVNVSVEVQAQKFLDSFTDRLIRFTKKTY